MEKKGVIECTHNSIERRRRMTTDDGFAELWSMYARIKDLL
ncbi:hypothetical protein CUMW_131590 [Citrus unshiu]|uniref:Uncharacterized protein n=1 Tax=Citrus unshiu TaxID=55188 RepID=A0A2H5PG38_CITUN|nr:hypothetical protein CUMW_131590 [Citrus unshiu]